MILKKTKIVCTIGPASWDPSIIKRLIEAGMNCARVNGAFANPEELDKVKKLVKDISDEVSLMVDIKGPEVRLNKFANPIPLRRGMEIIIGNDDSSEIYPSNYTDLYKHLESEQRIVIGDGDVEMVINEIRGDKMICTVVFGEILQPGKALNLPGANYVTETLTAKDIENLKHAVATGWDFVSPSFIQNADAAREVQKYLLGTHTKIIAKIEDQQGIDNIDEILNEVEGIMIARGGLGVELGLEKVPLAQRYLLMKANEVGKPVITATQMMESMIEKPRPTRAEVNDVATAIMMGTDGIMLSGESAMGKFPVETVEAMTKIALSIEEQLDPHIQEMNSSSQGTTDALSRAVAQFCINDPSISKVIVVSRTGRTARLIGRHGIRQPIYMFCSTANYARRLMLSKGIVRAFVQTEITKDRDQAVKIIINRAKEEKIVTEGDRVLFVAKTPLKEIETYFPNVFEIVTV